MKKLKKTLSLLVLAGVLMTVPPAMVRNAEADTANELQEVPPTRLTFEYEPEFIQQNAKAGKFLRIRPLTKSMSWEAFETLKRGATDANKAGGYIGVVVDSTKENWPEHINKVYVRIKQLMMGNKEKGIKGFAELYGARISGTIPIEYDPTDTYKFRDKRADDPNAIVALPIEVNDIIVAINDHHLAVRAEDDPDGDEIRGSFINTLEELDDWLGTTFWPGRHLYAADEYKKYSDEIKIARKPELDAYRVLYKQLSDERKAAQAQ